jgi:hypothetical protein
MKKIIDLKDKSKAKTLQVKKAECVKKDKKLLALPSKQAEKIADLAYKIKEMEMAHKAELNMALDYVMNNRQEHKKDIKMVTDMIMCGVRKLNEIDEIVNSWSVFKIKKIKEVLNEKTYMDEQ